MPLSQLTGLFLKISQVSFMSCLVHLLYIISFIINKKEYNSYHFPFGISDFIKEDKECYKFKITL